MTADLKDPGSYRHWHEDVLRFGDMDMVWHIDHAVYVTLFQGARIEFWKWAKHDIFEPEHGLVMVHVSVDYHRGLEFPGRSRIGTRIQKMGNSSVTYAQALFDQGGQLCATCEAVNVRVALKTNTPAPWPAELKARLLAL
ncbi:MAG: thioesterase family protein [Alphaproteobacteria bacterium]